MNAKDPRAHIQFAFCSEVLGPAPTLDAKFVAFGKVVDWINVLGAFEKEDVDREKPKRRLEILSTMIEP